MARRAYESAVVSRQADTVVMEDVCRWSRRWLDQELALAMSDQDKIAAIKAQLDRIQYLARHEFRQVVDLEYYLTEAELMLAEIRPDPKFEAAVAARKALQGDWQVVSEATNGANVEPPDWDTVEITGRRIRLSSDALGSGWGLVTIDATAVPARLEFFGFIEDVGFGGRGIFKLEGGRLTLCLTEGENWPKDFSTHRDDGARLYVLKRKAHDENQPPRAGKPAK